MGGVRPNASENGQVSPMTTIRAALGDESCPNPASLLPEGRKTANIYPNSRVIRGILDQFFIGLEIRTRGKSAGIYPTVASLAITAVLGHVVLDR